MSNIDRTIDGVPEWYWHMVRNGNFVKLDIGPRPDSEIKELDRRKLGQIQALMESAKTDWRFKKMPNPSEVERVGQLEEKLNALELSERTGSRRINPFIQAYPYVPGKGQYDEIKAEIAEIKKRLETPEWKEVNEKQRVYKYDTFILTLNDVKRIKVSKSGNHYIECRTGKYVVSPGWRYIHIDVENWTF